MELSRSISGMEGISVEAFMAPLVKMKVIIIVVLGPNPISLEGPYIIVDSPSTMIPKIIILRRSILSLILNRMSVPVVIPIPWRKNIIELSAGS